ncbi:MAG: hypothetical protein ABI602_01350 [Candidatus Saccharibacteria bacterium]
MEVPLNESPVTPPLETTDGQVSEALASRVLDLAEQISQAAKVARELPNLAEGEHAVGLASDVLDLAEQISQAAREELGEVPSAIAPRLGRLTKVTREQILYERNNKNRSLSLYASRRVLTDSNLIDPIIAGRLELKPKLIPKTKP